MSAWVVDRETIDLLVSAGLAFPGRCVNGSFIRWAHDGRRYNLTPANADVIGGKLWAENYASVHGRYPTSAADEVPGPVDFEVVDTLLYTFDRIPGTLDPVVVLKVLACYEYQSCEHAGWESSEARAICEALRGACIRVLPGYDEAPWSFGDRNYFVT